MKKRVKKKDIKPRLPMEAVLKLRDHRVSTKKGKKGFDKKSVRQQTGEIIKEEFIEEIN
jgi:hypothetical protein